MDSLNGKLYYKIRKILNIVRLEMIHKLNINFFYIPDTKLTF